MKRASGVLLPVSSLPSRYGIGDLGSGAYRFVDWLKSCGQSYWQLLPLGVTGYGDSPYQSFSAFAGNPYFISLEQLVSGGLLEPTECENSLTDEDSPVDYGRLYARRYPLLKKAFGRIGTAHLKEISEFEQHNPWLEDYSLFMALKEHFGGAAFWQWEEDIRLRKREAVEQYTLALSEQIQFHKFLQYCFFRQWQALRSYAHSCGIRIIGDIPIYVASDSVEVWSSPQLFQLDEGGCPIAVAGCPPDGFAAEGQLWGNPLYNWEQHRSTGFSWWISRLAHCFELYDVVRIDHFRGFDEYYSISFGEPTAKNGEWKKAYGSELFAAVKSTLGSREIIAEDLGFVTESVWQLVRECGFPNMKVLEFAFDSRDSSGSEHLPHRYAENCVAYTGTHDNQTIASWYSTITAGERQAVREYLCDFHTPESELHLSLISLIMRSRADLCVIPMQDWLGLTDKARVNTPSTLGGNWQWRMKNSDMSDLLSKSMMKMTRMYDRTP